MCGIAGIFAQSADAPPVSETELLAIRDNMALRGPDGVGLWMSDDRRVGLAHRRLAIIDLSDAGLQPMSTADGSAIITFNGEIYNYKELRLFLEQRGFRFRTSSDTEVILQLYVYEGAQMLSRLRGMFAFAIWDTKKRRMLLARDPLGIKPLYYTEGPTFRFASQVKALMAGGAVSSTPDPAGCVSFFLLGYVAEPFTIRQEIRSLPAGHRLWVNESGIGSPQPFFSMQELSPHNDQERISADATPAEKREYLKSSLLDSVAAHLVSDVPVGVFLSAGIDSTAITSLASGLSARLKTLTLGFDEYQGTAADEAPIAEVVAEIFHTDHRTIRVHSEDFRGERERLFAAMDQPTIDGVNTYFVSRAAAQTNLKVVLSGVGGDELFGGYPSFAQVPKIAHRLAAFRAIPAFGRVFRRVSSKLIGSAMSPKFAGLIEYGTSIEDAYLLRRALYMPWELPQLLDPEIVRAGWARLQPLLSFQELTAGLHGDRAQVAALEMSWYMRNQLLRDTDWAGMAHSIEIRTPFVDVELLRRVASMLQGPHPVGKLDMAQATPIGGIPAVTKRPKTGFTVPVREWLLEGAEIAQPKERGLRSWAKFVFQEYLAA